MAITCSGIRLLLNLLFASYAYTVTIPKPSGLYGVDVATHKLTDTSRLDSFAPTREYRSVMISVFYPSANASDCDVQLAQYMPSATAKYINAEYSSYGVPNGTFASLELSLCQPAPSVAAQVSDWPLVLFSPGHGNSRLLYSVIAQSVASYGYMVVTIDHPYDADIVEYPDGMLVFAANISTNPQVELDVSVRAQDASFVLDALRTRNVAHALFPELEEGLRTNRVAMYGHSLGGATAASAMANDSRIIGGVNFDGELFGPVIGSGLHDPFLFFGHDANATESTWLQIWPHLSWKLQLELLNSTHGTFTDLPFLAELLYGDPLPLPFQQLLGSLPGHRGLEAMTAYLVAFFDMVLGCEPSSLLQRPSAAYPEVVFVR